MNTPGAALCPQCGRPATRRLGQLECVSCGKWFISELPEGGPVPPPRPTDSTAAIRDAIEIHRSRGIIETSIAQAENPGRIAQDRLRMGKLLFLAVWLAWNALGRAAIISASGLGEWRVYLGLALMTLFDLGIRYTALFIDWPVFKQVAIGLAVAGAVLVALRSWNSPAPLGALGQLWPLIDLLLLGWYIYLLWTDLRRS